MRSEGMASTDPPESLRDRCVVDEATGCWTWTSTIRHRGRIHQYGCLSVDGRQVTAHRHSYELAHGPVPEGLVLDHLCRNTLCINPAHLEPVTTRENTIERGVGNPAAENAAKDECAHGHPFTEPNTYITPDGRRQCRACNVARTAKYKRRKRQCATA